MDSEPAGSDILIEAVKRAPMLAALREEPQARHELETRLDISKSTAHRNTKSLAERGLLKKSNGDFVLTEFGQAVADVVAAYEKEMDTTVRLAPVFEAVSGTDPPCPIEAFADATVTSADRGDPFGPLARFVSLVRESDSLRMFDSYAIAPTYIDEIHGRILDGMRTIVVEHPDVTEDIMENYPAKCVQLCASEFLEMRLHERLPFGLVILDNCIGIGVRDSETGIPRAFVDTKSNEAREWAETIFEPYWNEAVHLERFNPKALRETIEASAE